METLNKHKIKEHDVYYFRYKEHIAKEKFEPYHCFDGTLIVKKRNNGELFFEDTYWVAGDNKRFEIDEAFEKGYLTFECNLNNVEKAKEHDREYYDDDDFFMLFIHGGYRNLYFIKKGAVRSKSKMINSIKRKIEKEKSKLEYTSQKIERLERDLKKIESGNIDVTI